MVENNKTSKVDSAEETNFSVISDSKFWKDDYTTEDFITLFRVDGKARKACKKFCGDVASKAWKSNSAQFETIREELEFDKAIRYAAERAYVGGVAFLYLGFSDSAEAEEPVSTRMVPDLFKVIPSSQIVKDEYKRAKYIQDCGCYEVYQMDGTTLRIHESRIILIQFNAEQDSLFRPAMRSFQVTSSMLWSFGQASFRMAAGLTHVSIKNPKPTRTTDGQVVNEIQKTKSDGIFSRMNAETAFITDDRYTVDVKGVQGGRISPRDYWDVGIENLSIDLGIPKQIFIGTNAGSITGSETNVRDYISDITELREDFMINVTNQLAEKVGIPRFTLEFETLWIPTDEEAMKSMNDAADALKKFTESGMSLQSGVDYVNKILGTEFTVADFPDAQNTTTATDAMKIATKKTKMEPFLYYFSKDLFSEWDAINYLENRGYEVGFVNGEHDKYYTIWIDGAGEYEYDKEVLYDVEEGVKAYFAPKVIYFDAKDAKEQKSLYDDPALGKFETRLTNGMLKIFDNFFEFPKIQKVLKGSVYFDSLIPKRKMATDAEQEGNLVIEQEATAFDSALKIYMAEQMPKGFDLAYIAAQALTLDKTDMSGSTENIRNYVKEKSFNDVTGITDSMKKDLKRVLQESIENETNPTQAAKAFRQYVSDDFANRYKNRLKVIAEQETIDVFNDAAVQQYKDAGVEKHEWLTAGDDLVRPEHRKANGSIVKIGEKFPYVDVVRPPADIRCRCTTIPILKED